jgi:cholesterol transport system auxiliary component
MLIRNQSAHPTPLPRTWRGLPFTGLLVLAALQGCALLGKSEAIVPRYFSPAARPPSTQRPAPVVTPEQAPLELKLGRVTAASYLDERIVFRDANRELSFYEERRWTESPETYMRRFLSQSLFEEHGVRRIISGAGPTLEVELTEFAEIRSNPPIARVSATYILYDGRVVRTEASITVELPITSSGQQQDTPGATVQVMSDALAAAVNQVTERVLAELRSPPPETQ